MMSQIMCASLPSDEQERLEGLEPSITKLLGEEGIPIRNKLGFALVWCGEGDCIRLRREENRQENEVIFSIARDEFKSLSNDDFLDRFQKELLPPKK